jgi:hypothetical protein
LSLIMKLFLLPTGCRGTNRYLVDERKWKCYWFHGIVVGKISTSLFTKKLRTLNLWFLTSLYHNSGTER